MTVTFTFPDEWGPRILTAFTRYLKPTVGDAPNGTPRAATLADIKRFMWQRVREAVVQSEREAALEGISVPKLDDPT